MTRRLVLGRAGAGKTHSCLERLTDALKKRQTPLLLVPTYGQAEHLRYLLLDRAGGISARTVETFTSLAERVARQRLSSLVPAPVRDRVAAKVLEPLFPEAAGLAGFRAEFLVAVKELKEQGEEVASTLERARERYPDEASRGRRLFLAYARYVERLPGPDHEDLLLRTRDHLRESPPELDLFLVDGFFDFTPVQHEILELLAAHAAETDVTLPLHPVAARARFEGFERLVLRGNHRAAGALAHLERRLFEEPAEKAPADGIEVIACASEEDEADRLARIVAASGRPFRDFLLVRRDYEGLHALYRAAFSRYGIPLRFFAAEPLGRTPVARAVSLWLRRSELSPRELLPMLRSPYLLDAPPRDEIDRLAEEDPDSLESFPAIRALVERDEACPFGLRDALVDHPDGDADLARAGAFLEAFRGEIDAWPDPAHLLRRIPLIRGAAPDRRHDCVYAVTADDARQWEQPVVMVAGLTADAFPKQARQDIFLRDDERGALELPLRAAREEEERYLFYVAMTRARERLVLTYAAFDEEGTPRAPSPYLEQALAHFDRLEKREVTLAEQFVQPRDAVRADDLLPILADGLRHQSALAVALHDLDAVPRALLAWPPRLELSRTLPIRDLPGDYARRLSASSVNSYRRCPFLFLASKVLRVQPARERALDALERGNIVHEVLERYAKQGGDCGAIFDEVFEASTRGLDLGLDGEYWRRWMRAAALREAEAMVREDVVDAERPFDVPLESTTLRGRIDRIDRCGDGVLVRDYKTGKVDVKAAVAHDDVQLDAYLLAVDNPKGALFQVLKENRSVGFVLAETGIKGRGITPLTPAELEERRARTREIIEEVAASVRAGRLAAAPRDPENCRRDRCDGYDLCRVARARWLAKREER